MGEKKQIYLIVGTIIVLVLCVILYGPISKAIEESKHGEVEYDGASVKIESVVSEGDDRYSVRCTVVVDRAVYIDLYHRDGTLLGTFQAGGFDAPSYICTCECTHSLPFDKYDITKIRVYYKT